MLADPGGRTARKEERNTGPGSELTVEQMRDRALSGICRPRRRRAAWARISALAKTLQTPAALA